MENLNKLQALILRPIQPDGHNKDSLLSQITLEGAVSHHYPVMKITPLASLFKGDLISRHLLNISMYDRVIFISRAAVFYVFDWLKRNAIDYSGGLAAGPRYYAIGKSTATALKLCSVNAEFPNREFSSEGLLALPSLQRPSDEKILIFSGVGGRKLLSDQLYNRGATVNQCELYCRSASQDFSKEINTLIYSDQLDVIIIHSGELLDNLVSQVSGEGLYKLMRLPLLVPSQRIALLANKMGFKNIVCSPSAAAEDMISALREWSNNRC